MEFEDIQELSNFRLELCWPLRMEPVARPPKFAKLRTSDSGGEAFTLLKWDYPVLVAVHDQGRGTNVTQLGFDLPTAALLLHHVVVRGASPVPLPPIPARAVTGTEDRVQPVEIGGSSSEVCLISAVS